MPKERKLGVSLEGCVFLSPGGMGFLEMDIVNLGSTEMCKGCQ